MRIDPGAGAACARPRSRPGRRDGRAGAARSRRGPVSTTSTRRPRAAAASASAAATVVLPVPPLPVTTSRRRASSGRRPSVTRGPPSQARAPRVRNDPAGPTRPDTSHRECRLANRRRPPRGGCVVVVCESCSTRFRIDDARIPAKGRAGALLAAARRPSSAKPEDASFEETVAGGRRRGHGLRRRAGARARRRTCSTRAARISAARPRRVRAAPPSDEERWEFDEEPRKPDGRARARAPASGAPGRARSAASPALDEIGRSDGVGPAARLGRAGGARGAASSKRPSRRSGRASRSRSTAAPEPIPAPDRRGARSAERRAPAARSGAARRGARSAARSHSAGALALTHRAPGSRSRPAVHRCGAAAVGRRRRGTRARRAAPAHGRARRRRGARRARALRGERLRGHAVRGRRASSRGRTPTRGSACASTSSMPRARASARPTWAGAVASGARAARARAGGAARASSTPRAARPRSVGRSSPSSRACRPRPQGFGLALEPLPAPPPRRDPEPAAPGRAYGFFPSVTSSFFGVTSIASLPETPSLKPRMARPSPLPISGQAARAEEQHDDREDDEELGGSRVRT